MFNENLIKLRKRENLSQEELGDKINVSRQTISKWELGETTPEMDKLLELSKIFQISIDELIGNDNYVNKRILHKNYFEYKSKSNIKGIPLVHINIGLTCRKAKGIIAIGNISKGLISIGGIALGLISLGGIGIGLFTFAGIALGILIALGGIAVGTLAIGGIALGIMAIGGLAFGIYAFGGCAIAKNIASGDYASGIIAIGNHVKGDIEFLLTNPNSSTEIKNAIIKEFPNTWKIIIYFFSNIQI